MKNSYVGFDALEKRKLLHLEYPVREGIIIDWEGMEAIYSDIIYEKLKVDPEQTSFLITESAHNPERYREKMTEIFFETFNCKALYCNTRASLSLVSQNKTTGVVVQSGYSHTEIIPIFEGKIISEAAQTISLGGLYLTNYFMELLLEKGHSFVDTDIVENIKKELGFVLKEKPWSKELDCVNSESGHVYELPDGQTITLGNERFFHAEALFEPSLMGMAHSGIHTNISRAIDRCPVDTREFLSNNILLCGGNMLYPGILERIELEMSSLLKCTIERVPELLCTSSSWVGGSILTSTSTFEEMMIHSREYKEEGPSIIQKCNRAVPATKMPKSARK